MKQDGLQLQYGVMYAKYNVYVTMITSMSLQYWTYHCVHSSVAVLHAHYQNTSFIPCQFSPYRMVGNIGGGFNLVVWQFSGNPQNLKTIKICSHSLCNVNKIVQPWPICNYIY